MKLFDGAAVFSPSVKLAIKDLWLEHGGTTVGDPLDEDMKWLFCNGKDDEWLQNFSDSLFTVFDAEWIIECVLAKHELPLSLFVIGRYESRQKAVKFVTTDPGLSKATKSVSFLSDNSTLVDKSSAIPRPAIKIQCLAESPKTINQSLSMATSFSLSANTTLLTSTPAKWAPRSHPELDPEESEVALLLGSEVANKENKVSLVKDRRRERRFFHSPFRYRPAPHRISKEKPIWEGLIVRDLISDTDTIDVKSLMAYPTSDSEVCGANLFCPGEKLFGQTAWIKRS